MNQGLNRRVHNFLGRLHVYFERPQIFDNKAMAAEAYALMLELDANRDNEVTK